jgi:hypothetical protein
MAQWEEAPVFPRLSEAHLNLNRDKMPNHLSNRSALLQSPSRLSKERESNLEDRTPQNLVQKRRRPLNQVHNRLLELQSDLLFLESLHL